MHLENLQIHVLQLKGTALRELVAKLCKEYPIIEVLGHRDTSPDLDGSGEVEPGRIYQGLSLLRCQV